MAVIHVTVAEAALDLPGLLLKAKAGDDVQIEGEAGEFRLTAVLHDPSPIVVRHTEPRLLSVVLAELRQRNSGARLDEEYAHDVQEFIDAGQRERWSSWEPS